MLWDELVNPDISWYQGQFKRWHYLLDCQKLLIHLQKIVQIYEVEWNAHIPMCPTGYFTFFFPST